MFYSDQEQSDIIQQTQEQFTIHQPTFKLNKTEQQQQTSKVDYQKITYIQNKCMQIKQEIYSKEIEYFCQCLLTMIQDNSFKLNPSKSQNNQNIEEEIKQQTKQEKQEANRAKTNKKPVYYHQLIIPICIKRNQESDLDRYIPVLKQKIKTRNNRKSRFNTMDVQQPQKQKLNNQLSSQNQLIICKNFQKVRYIGLKIFEHLKRKQHKSQQNDQKLVYISAKPTNLDQKNIRVFDDGLKNCNCIIILPTFTEFDFYNLQVQGLYTVIPFSLFDSKALFAKFMYRCLTDRQITAYLPRQSLLLLKQVKDFPISYSQACRRLIYLIRKLHMLAQQKNITFQFIDIDKLLTIFNKGFDYLRSRTVGQSQYDHQCIILPKQISLILNQYEPCNVISNQFHKIMQFVDYQYEADTDKERQNVISKFKEIIHDLLIKQKDLECYAQQLKQDPFVKKSQMIRKRNRFQDRYNDIVAKRDSRMIVEEQLRRILAKHTHKIREQAHRFQWEQFNYIQRIKPMIAFDTNNQILKSQYLGNLFRYLKKKSNTGMSVVCAKFGPLQDNLRKQEEKRNQQIYFSQDQQMQGDQSADTMKYMIKCGKLTHMIKQLQLYGMINIQRTNVNPKILLQYYPLAHYSVVNIKQKQEGDTNL